MKFKHILLFILAATVLVGCNAPKGELVGRNKRATKFKEAHPYGMVFIHKGHFMMGNNKQSAVFDEPDNQMMATVDAFWMDETEITNNEYKQFVDWVRDSIAYDMLIQSSEENAEIYAKPLIKSADAELDTDTANGKRNFKINWKKKIPWNKYIPQGEQVDAGEYADEDEFSPAIASLFYENTGQINVNRFQYRYSWLNYDELSKIGNRFDVATGAYPPGASVHVDVAWVDDDHVIHVETVERELTSPKDLETHMIIGVYPDTLVWERDFENSHNEPEMFKYFGHPGFNDYPVVGVTWEQADAFCHWRTDFFANNSGQNAQPYRLPNEAEWEFAARGGRKFATYPWGGNYVRNEKGCYLANFKPYHGGYEPDGAVKTWAVAQYRPNDFGLFDMAGNVAEWTCSQFINSSSVYVHDLNPTFIYRARRSDPEVLKRKVIRGGSWKDISYYLQCGSRTYEYQYEARSYIGFRCVRSIVGDKHK